MKDLASCEIMDEELGVVRQGIAELEAAGTPCGDGGGLEHLPKEGKDR